MVSFCNLRILIWTTLNGMWTHFTIIMLNNHNGFNEFDLIKSNPYLYNIFTFPIFCIRYVQ